MRVASSDTETFDSIKVKVEDPLSVFRSREMLCEAKSLFNAERVIESCFEMDWISMQKGKGDNMILANLGLSRDPAGPAKLARCKCKTYRPITSL